MATKTANPMKELELYPSTASVTSQDGTLIAYRQLGTGPGLLVVHGMMESANSHEQLAKILADQFTVTLMDRRGRGLSGAHGPDYAVHKEVEDIQAVLTATGAHFVFGVSAGGAASLQAALNLPTIRKLALFDPALVVAGSVPMGFLARYEAEIAQKKPVEALVTAMQGTQMGPPIFNAFPRWLLKLLTRMMISAEQRSAPPGAVTMRLLAPTLHYDFLLVKELEGQFERFKTLTTDVLLLGGGASPTYFRTALDALEKTLPRVKRIEFPGLGHGASGNADRGGKAEVIARELRTFFG